MKIYAVIYESYNGSSDHLSDTTTEIYQLFADKKDAEALVLVLRPKTPSAYSTDYYIEEMEVY